MFIPSICLFEPILILAFVYSDDFVDDVNGVTKLLILLGTLDQPSGHSLSQASSATSTEATTTVASKSSSATLKFHFVSLKSSLKDKLTGLKFGENVVLQKAHFSKHKVDLFILYTRYVFYIHFHFSFVIFFPKCRR